MRHGGPGCAGSSPAQSGVHQHFNRDCSAPGLLEKVGLNMQAPLPTDIKGICPARFQGGWEWEGMLPHSLSFLPISSMRVPCLLDGDTGSSHMPSILCRCVAHVDVPWATGTSIWRDRTGLQTCVCFFRQASFPSHHHKATTPRRRMCPTKQESKHVEAQ